MLRRALPAAALAAGLLAVPGASAAPPRVPCTIVPTVTTTRPSVTTWYTLTAGPWVAEAGVDSVTIDCRVYVTGSPLSDGAIGTARTTTPGIVGVAAGVPFRAAAETDLTVCTTVIYEYFWPFFWDYLAYDACVVVPA